jgi:hypothetical protein
MSAGGIFVLTPTCPPVHAVLQTEILFPGPHGNPNVEMKAEMKVLRVEHPVPGEKGSGFSAVGDLFAVNVRS